MYSSRLLILFFLCLLTAIKTYAVDERGLFLGVSYYSQNAFGKTTHSNDSSSSLLGTSSYPLMIKYFEPVFPGTFFSPEILYAVIPRNTASDSAKVTYSAVNLLIVSDLFLSGANFDWNFGPGLNTYQIKGNGGIKQLNNGTGTASFASPNQTVYTNNFTLNLGLGYNIKLSRIAFNFIIEAPFSYEKRAQSFSLSYAYQLTHF